jgi:hypothetical protein
MSDSLSQHCLNCKAQTIEIEYWQLQARSARKELKSEQKRADNAMDNYDAGVRRVEAQAAEISELRAVVDALLQHEASTFFGPDADKHMRASWRNVFRKAKKARAGKAEQ